MFAFPRCNLKRCLWLAFALYSAAFIALRVSQKQCNNASCFIERRLTNYDDRSWWPPKKYRADLDEFLVYRSELEPALQKRVIDKHCAPEATFVMFVHSCVHCKEHRDLIRRTYKQNALSVHRCDIFFAVGSTGNQSAMRAVKQEDERHRDIVQFDFLDSYKNVTIKLLSGLKWAHGNCPHTQFVMKGDDDIYYNLDVITRGLRNVSDHYKNAIMGFHFGNYDWFNHAFGHKQFVPREVSHALNDARSLTRR